MANESAEWPLATRHQLPPCRSTRRRRSSVGHYGVPNGLTRGSVLCHCLLSAVSLWSSAISGSWSGNTGATFPVRVGFTSVGRDTHRSLGVSDTLSVFVCNRRPQVVTRVAIRRSVGRRRGLVDIAPATRPASGLGPLPYVARFGYGAVRIGNGSSQSDSSPRLPTSSASPSPVRPRS